MISRNKIFKKVSSLAVNNTSSFSLILILITCLLGYYASGLYVSPSITEMLPDGDKRAKAFESILNKFNNSSNIIIIIEGEEEKLKSYSNYIKPRLLELNSIVDRVDDKAPTQFFIDHGLKLLSLSELESFKDLFINPNLIPFLSNLNDSFEKEFIGDDGLDTKKKEDGAVRFLDGIEKFIVLQSDIVKNGYQNGYGQIAVDAITIGEEFILNIDKNMMLIMVEPKFNMFEDIYLVIDAVNTIDELILETSKKFNINAGLTGTMVLQRDEMEALKNDSFSITLLALISIFVLFVISFKMWTGPLLSIITVIIGVVWALGISSFLVENLTLITSGISIVLIGLAIDFSIHIISTFTEFKNKGFNDLDAMNSSLLKSGPGISTGAITTGMAFFTMIISDNKGMSEMGLVAGVGIIITMISTITVLPTLLIIRELILNKFGFKHKNIDTTYKPLGILAEFISNKKIYIFPIIFTITIFLFYKAQSLEFDYNILNLEPVGLDSVLNQEKMMDAFDMASDYIMITSSSIDSIRFLTEKAKNMRSAGKVESIIDFLPDKRYEAENFQYRRYLRRTIKNTNINKQLSDLDINKYLEEINRLEFNIIELQDLSYIGSQNKVYDKCARLVGEAGDSTILGIISEYSEYIKKNQNIKYSLTTFHQNFSEKFKKRILEMSNYKPLDFDLLPDEIKNRYVSKDNDIYLLTIYPNQIVWEDIEFLFNFTEEAEQISGTATGMPPIMVSYMNMMIVDGKNSTWFALIAIFSLLLIDMRKIKYSLTAMVPVIFGIIWMMGIMNILGLKLNMMNIMVIPLIIGIGIDDGIHIMHRYLIEKNIMTVFRSTGKAILLTSLTTMLAFGSLWFSTYRGLGSLGIALFIGSATCFLATILIIPLALNNK